MGFISNVDEEKKLNNAVYQKAIAKAICKGILDYNGKEYKDMAKLDNKPDEYAKSAIEWALKNKILKGDDKGDLMLHKNITRQDMIVMLYRIYKNIN